MATDPGREELERLIRETGGNMTQLSGLLGACRRSAYNWVHKHGLAELVGIPDVVGVHNAHDVHSVHAVHTGRGVDAVNTGVSASSVKKAVHSKGAIAPILDDMSSPVAHEIPDHVKLPRSTRLSEGAWRWAQHVAVDRRCSASDVVETALQRMRAELEKGGGQPGGDGK